MTALASASQLRMSFVRYALVTVPAVLLIGMLSGRISNSGYGNPWFDALVKPDAMPPGWLFGVAWVILYILLGLSLAMILHARGAEGRKLAVGLFLTQLALNYVWPPVFFLAHEVRLGLVLLMTILAFTIATAFLFGPIRKAAAWLLVPYMVWLSFATVLNYEIRRLNPDAESLVPGQATTDIMIR